MANLYDVGSKVVTWYSDDSVWHERLILSPGDGDGVYWVVKADHDIYEETLTGGQADGPARVRFVPFGGLCLICGLQCTLRLTSSLRLG